MFKLIFKYDTRIDTVFVRYFGTNSRYNCVSCFIIAAKVRTLTLTIPTFQNQLEQNDRQKKKRFFSCYFVNWNVDDDDDDFTTMLPI